MCRIAIQKKKKDPFQLHKDKKAPKKNTKKALTQFLQLASQIGDKPSKKLKCKVLNKKPTGSVLHIGNR